MPNIVQTWISKKKVSFDLVSVTAFLSNICCPPKKRRVLDARRENKKRKRYGYKGDVGTCRAPFIDRNGYQIQEEAS